MCFYSAYTSRDMLTWRVVCQSIACAQRNCNHCIKYERCVSVFTLLRRCHSGGKRNDRRQYSNICWRTIGCNRCLAVCVFCCRFRDVTMPVLCVMRVVCIEWVTMCNVLSNLIGVTGCVSVSGSIVVNLQQPLNSSTDLTLFQYDSNCSSPLINNGSIVVNSVNSICHPVTATPQQQAGSYAVLLTVGDSQDSSCSSSAKVICIA